MKEKWLPIYEYENDYEVSNFGKIRSKGRMVKRGKFLMYKRSTVLVKLLGKFGYHSVQLYLNGNCKRFYVHRLVACAFIPNPDNKPQVNHKNGNNVDNCVSNLEWTTSSENHLHAFATLKRKATWEGKSGYLHFSSKPVVQIGKDGTIVRNFGSIRQASLNTGAAPSAIIAVCKGTLKTSGGFKWKYFEKNVATIS